MKMKNGILVAVLACTSLVVTSCYTPYPTYGGVAVGVGPGGVSTSVEWTSASYDADGYPIYGYSYGRPVYGYTAAGVAIFTLAALTTAYYLPYWGCAHWCHHHDVYVHYCPSHCHRCWAPDRCPRGHHPHVRPPHDGPHPGKGVRVHEPSHRGVPDSGRPPMHGGQGPHNGGHNGGMNAPHNGGHNGGMNAPRNGGHNGIQNMPRGAQNNSMRGAQNNMPQRGMQNNSMRGAQNNMPQRGMQNNSMPRQRVQGGGMQGARTPQGGGIRSYGPGASNRSALGGGRPSMPSASSESRRTSSPSFGGGVSRSTPSHGSFGGGSRGGMGGGHFGGGHGGRR